MTTSFDERQQAGVFNDEFDGTNQAVEAEDLAGESNRVSIFQQLLYRMNPAQCLAPGSQTGSCHNPFFDEVDLEDIVIALLKDIRHEGKARTAALHKLYRFTDRERHYNRYVSFYLQPRKRGLQSSHEYARKSWFSKRTDHLHNEI